MLSACGSSEAPASSADDAADGTAADDGTTAATGEGSVGEPAAVTYWTDIKPLLDARCAGCHIPDGIAPFALETFDDAVAFAPSAVPSVLAKTMPPWPPNADCSEHVADRSLTDEQIDLFMEWIDLGMPEGDPANEGAPMDAVSPGLSRIDQTMAMPEAYAVQNTPDDYRCFVLPWPEEHTTTKYVTGFGGVPGNSKTVHHIIAFLASPSQAADYVQMDEDDEGPGYECFGGTGGDSRTWLGAWAPGGGGSDLPDGLGLAVEPGSAIVLQVHYNALTTDEAPDLSSIELKLDDEVEKQAFVIPFANPAWLLGGMHIPAGEPDTMHTFDADIADIAGQDVSVYSSSLHMHLLGSSAQLSIDRADGSNECLLQIDDWDFAWQGSYGYNAPRHLTSGDRVRLECHYDNSADNQPYIDGVRTEPADASWGEGTTDEMCLGVMLATVD